MFESSGGCFSVELSANRSPAFYINITSIEVQIIVHSIIICKQADLLHAIYSLKYTDNPFLALLFLWFEDEEKKCVTRNCCGC